MKTLNKQTLRKLILETIEEESLGEAKKKEVEEEYAETPVQTDVAAKGQITAPESPDLQAMIDKLQLALQAAQDPKSDELRKAGAAQVGGDVIKQIKNIFDQFSGKKQEE